MSIKRHPAGKILFTLLLAGAYSVALIVLAYYYGNPQWHKNIYMFQRYKLEKFGYHPPYYYNYTGTYRSWYEDGTPCLVAQMKNGIYVGEYSAWDKEGNVISSGTYKDGLWHSH